MYVNKILQDKIAILRSLMSMHRMLGMKIWNAQAIKRVFYNAQLKPAPYSTFIRHVCT